MTYTEARQEILLLMSQVRDAIDAAPPEAHERLKDVASDDLHDALTGEWNPSELAAAFTEAARRFWLRENELHSVKSAPVLELVKGDDAA